MIGELNFKILTSFALQKLYFKSPLCVYCRSAAHLWSWGGISAGQRSGFCQPGCQSCWGTGWWRCFGTRESGWWCRTVPNSRAYGSTETDRIWDQTGGCCWWKSYTSKSSSFMRTSLVWWQQQSGCWMIWGWSGTKRSQDLCFFFWKAAVWRK